MINNNADRNGEAEGTDALAAMIKTAKKNEKAKYKTANRSSEDVVSSLVKIPKELSKVIVRLQFKLIDSVGICATKTEILSKSLQAFYKLDEERMLQLLMEEFKLTTIEEVTYDED